MRHRSSGSARGVEKRPWPSQGARFGLAVALLTAVPMYMIYYVVQPMPGSMAVKQILFDSLLIVVLGIIVAWFYRAPGDTDYLARASAA